MIKIVQKLKHFYLIKEHIIKTVIHTKGKFAVAFCEWSKIKILVHQVWFIDCIQKKKYFLSEFAVSRIYFQLITNVKKILKIYL